MSQLYVAILAGIVRRADKRRIAEWMQTQNADVRPTKTQEPL